MSSDANASLGVIGGSGLYDLGAARRGLRVETPYGLPSDAVSLVEIAGRVVAFLPRHGRSHTIPPHRINYRANLWALRSLGVERVIGPCAVGSLQSALTPGSALICDQFVDRTRGRADTYFDGPEVAHLSSPEPYCAEMRPLAAAACRGAGMEVREGGTIVVIQGPRFSTRAESAWFQQLGWAVVGMTQYPEVVLARELGMCYVTMAVITDYDAGVPERPDVAPVTQEQVLAVFEQNRSKLGLALGSLIATIPPARGCSCAAATPRSFSTG